MIIMIIMILIVIPLVVINNPYHINNNVAGKEEKYRSKSERIQNKKDEKSIYKCE